MKKLYLAASGIFSAVPGLAVVWKGLGVPPGHSMLFGGFIEAAGALTLILLWVRRRELERRPARRAIRAAAVLGGLCFSAFIAYSILLNACVKTHPIHGTVYYPLWTSGKLKISVERAGGRWQALDRYGQAEIEDELQMMPSFVLSLTTILLLVLYMTIFAALTAAFSLLGYHKGANLIGGETRTDNKHPRRKKSSEL
jgi:multisubunit Na+/H+ antiporter MnhB subunit